VEAQRKATEAEKRKQDELTRERDILNKLKTQAENATTKQQDLVRVNEGAKKNLEQEIQGYRAEAERQQKLILQLEREREKYGAEASQVGAKYLQVIAASHPPRKEGGLNSANTRVPSIGERVECCGIDC
jgi:phage shock protein A